MRSGREHYHDIDGVRAALMFSSLLIHATTVYAVSRPEITRNADRLPFFDWLMHGLHLFITPGFFLVSGFFTAVMLSRKSPGAFLRDRLMRLGVPMVTTALTLNVVENYLRWRDAGGSAGFVAYLGSRDFLATWTSGEWQLHLWFIICLFPLFLAAMALQTTVPREAAIRRRLLAAAEWVGRFAARPLGWLVVLFGLGLANTANFAGLSLLPAPYDPLFPGMVSASRLLAEMPFFVGGMFIAVSPKLLAAARQWRPWMVPVAIALFVWGPHPRTAGDDAALQLVLLVLYQFTSWALVLFIIQIYYRYCREPSPLRSRLADAALSVYLIHHCLVYVVGRLFVEVDLPPIVEFTTLTVIVAGAVLIFHAKVIRRSPLLRLLFNGKTDIARIAPAPAHSPI